MNRVIRIASSGNAVRAVIEDDFHHFRVMLEHDGERVTAIAAQPFRGPYSPCVMAGDRLRELVGTPLSVDVPALLRSVDQFQQCTHQLDIAILSIAVVARGEAARRYDLVVTDVVEGVQHGWLDRNGERVLTVSLRDQVITSPEPYAGRNVGAGFASWCAANLDPDAAEAALVFRRGIYISLGRRDRPQMDSVSLPLDRGGCWAKAPERFDTALRVRETTFDFSDRPEALTAGDEAWLAFSDS